MSRLRALLLREGEQLVLMITLFLMLRGCQMRTFARQVRDLERDVRGWLAEMAIARLKDAPFTPAPLRKRMAPARRASDIKRTPRKPVEAPVFRLPQPPGSRSKVRSSSQAPRTALARPYVPNRHLLAFARRLDAATHTLNHPEAAVSRLMARWRRKAADPARTARVHARARRYCLDMLFRRAPHLLKIRPSTDDRRSSLPPPDE